MTFSLPTFETLARLPIYRLCCYECDWIGTVDERGWVLGNEPCPADIEQDAHMAAAHDYPNAPMRYPAVRRTLGKA